MVPFLHVTTQIPGRKDDDLLQRKGGAGFPYFAALDAEGGLIAQNDGPRTVEGFQQMMRKGQEFLDLGAKAASGDEAATIEFALREAELGRIDYEAAKTRLGARTLTAEQSARLANIRAASVIHEQVNKINAAEGSEESFAAAADEFCKLLQSGAKPSPNTMDGNTFAQILARWAQTAEDPAKLDIVLAYFKDVLADNPRAQPFLDKLEGRVRDLKEGPSEEEPAEEEDGETDIEDSGD